MLSCKELVEHVDEYLDGELSMSARFGIRLHLLMCRACNRYVTQMRLVLGALSDLKPRESPDAALVSTLLALRDAATKR